MDLERVRAKALLRFLKSSNFGFKAPVKDGLSLIVANRYVGMIRLQNWKILRELTDAFELKGRAVVLTKWTDSFEISDNLEVLMKRMHQLDAFPALGAWTNKRHDVVERFGERPVFQMESSMSYLFGVKHYGVHINGYTIDFDGRAFFWLQKRSSSSDQYPGKLDSMVCGGLDSDYSIHGCIEKDGGEEGLLSDGECAAWCQSVGHVSFVFEDDKGIAPTTLFCYDALLPSNFQPKSRDDKVQEFVKVPLDDLLETAIDEAKFNVTSVPVILDFLVRHHLMDHRYGAGYFEAMSIIHHDLYTGYPPKHGTSKICALFKRSRFLDTIESQGRTKFGERLIGFVPN